MSNLQQEDSDSPRVSLSPSRKRSRVVDSDDETDYSCQTPDSFSPCPSPKKILMTPPMKRKTAHGTISDVPIVPFTPSTACKKLKVWQRYFGDTNLVDHPCPACGQLINIKKLNFSRDEAEGWGCSEKLERYRVEREIEADEGHAPSVHGIDWILQCYPLKLQEIAIRLQIAHGDLYGLSAGESLCLRFIRDVYGTGKAVCSSGESLGDWISQNVSYCSDILDIADAFSGHTDREMMNIIEMKKKLSTPLSNRKLTATVSSPAMIMRRSQPSTPLRLFSPGRVSEKKPNIQTDIQEENIPLNQEVTGE